MRSIAIYSAIVVLLPFLAHCADIEKLIAERRAEIFAKLKPAQHSNLLSVTHDYDAETIGKNGAALLDSGSTVSYNYLKSVGYETSTCTGDITGIAYVTTNLCYPTTSGSAIGTATGDVTTGIVTAVLTNYTTSGCSGTPAATLVKKYQNTTCVVTVDDDDTGPNENYDIYSGAQTIAAYTGSAIIAKAYLTSSACSANSGTTVGTAYVPSNFGACESLGLFSFKQVCDNGVPYIKVYTASGSCSGTSVTEPVSSGCELGDLGYVSVTCQGGGSDSTDKCFSGYETVALEDGSEKMISEVSVGDRILAYSPSTKSFTYSDVVYIPHEKNQKPSVFTQLATKDGRDIMLTPAHMIVAGDCGSELSLKAASSVSSGECLLDHNGKHVQVESTKSVQLNGIYTVVTQEEYIVVSGFVSSPFAVNHYFANKYYNIHRLVYSYMPSMLKSSVMSGVQSVANYVASVVGSL